MGRPSKLNISKEDFRELLLELYVDENYNKRSDREIMEDERIYEVGLFNIKEGIKCPSSKGSLSKYKRDLHVMERDVYEHYKEFIDVDFDAWSKRNNKGHKRKKVTKMSDDDIRRMMMDYFEIPYSSKPLQELKERIISRLEMMGLNGKREMEVFYGYLQKRA